MSDKSCQTDETHLQSLENVEIGDAVPGSEIPDDNTVTETEGEDVADEYCEIKHLCKESEQCKRQFKTKKGLDNHILLCHRPAVKFSCDFCGKSFNREKYLKKHKLTHDQPAVMCLLCKLDLKYPFRLKQHNEVYHTVENPICKVCGKEFDNRADLRNHNKTCLKKSNVLKYKNKENIVPDTSVHLNVSNTTKSSSNTPGLMSSIPLSSADSPTLVEYVPNEMTVLTFDQF